MTDLAWFLGIDLGTGSCKSVVIDENADALGFGVGEYTGNDAHDRWQEQNPRELLQAAITSVKNALARAEVDSDQCAGLSIGGALHSLLALDRSGQPLTGVITWADGRAVEQAEALRDQPMAARLYEQTGCPAHGMYPLYKIMWLRENRPEVFQNAWRYVTAKEYVFACLTGEYRVDYCLAAGSGLLNTHSLTWEPLCLDAAGIRRDQLSAPVSPQTVHNGLNPEMARQMGIRPDVPVVLGSADAANSNLGAGAVLPWQATCMIGTSGAYRVLYPEPILDRQARSWCYVVDEAHWLVGGAINNGGVALSWLRDCLNQAHPDSAAADGLSFEDVLALASRSPAGSDGVICLPLFAGERSPHWNLNARAAFFGMSLSHGVTHLSRALVEGIAFRFKSLSDVLAEVGVEVKQVIASGGFTQSDFWLQVVTDVLNREMVVPPWGETSCLGAAFWAMLGTGHVANLESLKNFVKPGSSCLPGKANAALYQRIYPMYQRLYQALSGNFAEIARLQQELAP
ncbi:Gluconokinase (EC [Olavius sp. associated proteobacterium Delta 1]|nr:Gluconokinase (EC [Olavius sp. associated proteobacterium Delta 1]